MKNALLLTALSIVLLFSNYTEAQVPVVSKVTKVLPKVDLGIKLGADFSQLHGLQNSYQPGVVGGVFVGVRKGKWGIRAEALVSTAKYTFTNAATQNATFKNIYLDVPVLLEYKIVNRLWVQIGPQFSNTISESTQGSAAESGFKSDFSGVLGLEARLPSHIIVGARYIIGLSNAYNANLYDANGYPIGSFNATIRTFQLYAGFKFL